MNHLTISFALCSLAGVAAADGTRTLASMDGKCAVAVPSTWKGDKTMATSPDKKRTATVSSPKMFDSFDELKKTAPTVYTKSKITKDTATELEMEGMSITDKPDVYRAIPTGTPKVFCIAEVIYETGTVDEARTIVRTLKPGK